MGKKSLACCIQIPPEVLIAMKGRAGGSSIRNTQQ